MFISTFSLPVFDDFEYISTDHKGRFIKWLTREYSASESPTVI